MLRAILSFAVGVAFAASGLQTPTPAPLVNDTNSVPSVVERAAGVVSTPTTEVEYVKVCDNGVCRLVPRIVERVVTAPQRVATTSVVQTRTMVYGGVPITLAPGETLVAVDGVPVSQTYRNWGAVRGQPVRNVVRGAVRCVGNVCGVR